MRKPLSFPFLVLFCSAALAAQDDPYGVGPATLDSAKAVDTAKVAKGLSDSLPKADSAITQSAPKDSLGQGDSAKAITQAAPDSAPAAPKAKRQKVVREVTVNTLDAIKGKYRSPKKALFMSLVVPGLGQAYVGQSAFNYIRAASYFLIDVSLGAAWYEFVSVRHKRQVKNYRAFADEHWRLSNYEDSLQARFGTTFGQEPSKAFLDANYLREFYCQSILGQGNSGAASDLYNGCRAYEVADTNYFPQLGDFVRAFGDREMTVEEIGEQRSKFFSTFDFYENIGKEQEFIVGWTDVNVISRADTGWVATSDYRNEYVNMRRKAERYSQMQAYFIGGMVANHIVSALDAALAARAHNRSLYESETVWLDRIRLDSRFAFQNTDLQSWVGAYLTF